MKYYYATITDSFETRISDRACIHVIPEKILESGNWGDNFEWELTESFTLKVSGNGVLVSPDTNDLPWSDYQEDIQALVVSEGVTAVCTDLFTGMSQLKTLSLPQSLQSISEGAFRGCNSLVDLNIPFVGTSRSENYTSGAVLGAMFGKVS